MSLATDLPASSILAQSQAYCDQLTRRAAKNFYYGLKLLPARKRAAMFALYAWMRHVDDIADDETGRSAQERAQELQSWRTQTHAALSSSPAAPADGWDVLHATRNTQHSLLWPAFTQMAQTFRIPPHIFDDVIAGQEQDLHPITFQTFDDLREYCYRVAGTVGLASIHIWGFEGGQSTECMAIDRGIAFQLTNILRDLREDASRGRLYLPRQELASMNVSEHDLQTARDSGSFRQMMRFQADRAQSFYAQSADLESRIERDSRASLVAMTQIYHGILKKVAANPQRVLHERISLSLFSKLRIGWRAVRGN